MEQFLSPWHEPLPDASASGKGLRVMRKLIRCRATKRFLTADGTWTHDFRQGATFQDQALVYAMKRKLKLEDVEMYYSLGEAPGGEYDFAIPLD